MDWRTLSSHSFDFHMKEEVLEHWKANEVLKGGGHHGSMVSKSLARQTGGVVSVDRDYLVRSQKDRQLESR